MILFSNYSSIPNDLHETVKKVPSWIHKLQGQGQKSRLLPHWIKEEPLGWEILNVKIIYLKDYLFPYYILPRERLTMFPFQHKQENVSQQKPSLSILT